MSMPRRCLVVFLLLAGCTRGPAPKQYELKGQILAVEPERQQLLVKHEDIKGFMPAMTMPYKVKDAALLNGKAPGDLVTATLVVGETDAYLANLTKTGYAPVDIPAATPEVSTFDLVKTGEPVPDAPLTDEEGQARSIASYKGHRLALTFIYTRCPDPEFCVLMDQNFVAVQKAIKSTPALKDVQLLSISFDPEFDTPAVLEAHAKALNADPAIWHFATAPRRDITAFASRFGVTVTSNGSPTLIHNLGTAVIDTQGRLVTLHSNNRWTPAELVAEIAKTPAPAR